MIQSLRVALLTMVMCVALCPNVDAYEDMEEIVLQITSDELMPKEWTF